MTHHHDNFSTQTHPQTATTFDELGLHPLILKALSKSGYTTPTPIQAGAIPHALGGRDLLLSAQTGSGKTASFVLPILDKLAKTPKAKPEHTGDFSQKSHRKHQKVAIKALILTPTRELAMQVQDNVRKYSSCMKGIFSVPLVGGAPYGGQIRALTKGVQIVIATPGRLIDHINDGRVDLSELDVLVLDEADRMLDMGFADAIETILAQVPTNRQTLMSSATWDGQVGKIAESFTNNPERVSIKVQSAHIDESVYFCDDFNHKNKLLSALLSDENIGQAIIFTATKRSTEQLAQTLNDQGLSARYLHGDLPQGKRNRIITDVKTGKCDFLIATDVAARGIDIATISHVVNYDLPRQVEDYVHRIGRCGRAGRTGVAMNLCSRDDHRQLSHINRYLGRDMKACVITGLEPKFTPKKDEHPRKQSKQGRKKFDKEERFTSHHKSERTERFGKKQNRGHHEDNHLGNHYPNNRYPNNHHLENHRPNADEYPSKRPYHKKATPHLPQTFDEYTPKMPQNKERSNRCHHKDDTTVPNQHFGGRVEHSGRFERGERVAHGGRDAKKSHAHNKVVSKVASLYDATSRPKKHKVIEEIFFDKCQAKKSKRFGQL